MKTAPLALFGLLLCTPISAHAGSRLIPAGALLQCTISGPGLSSKSAALGDPVLCKAGSNGSHSHFHLPYESYLGGHFQEYKDPGHFVGKGWMELAFDHVVIEPDTVVPVNARVVGVSGYNVDRQGRILGKGHLVRDTIEWMLPILWPLDLINLPRRGPRPTLKSETALTLMVMDDLVVPTPEPLPQDPSGLRRRAPTAYEEPAPAPAVPLEAETASAAASAPPKPSILSDIPPPRPEYLGTASPVAPADGSPSVYYLPPRPVYLSQHAGAWTPGMFVVYRDGIAYALRTRD